MIDIDMNEQYSYLCECDADIRCDRYWTSKGAHLYECDVMLDVIVIGPALCLY